jgi:DNA-binding LacI/PurR family transcriptional regulator
MPLRNCERGGMSAAELAPSPRLADIAAAAGVSLPTVSRALSGRGRVKDATRAHILAIARDAGYLPRVVPAVPTLAIVVYDSDTAIAERRLGHGYGSFDQRVLSGVGALAQETGAQLLLAHTAGDEAGELPPALTGGAVGGALLLGGMFPETFVHALACRLPVVLAGSFVPGGRINCVHPDYQTGALLATQHLLALGHRRIALLNGPLGTRSSAEKEVGYREALRAVGLPVADDLVARAGDFAVEDGKRATAQLFARGPFSALVAADDALAFGAVRLLGELGLRVPTDISVVGFYDGPLAPVCDPPLTTVNIHHHAIGNAAAHRLLDMLRDPQSPVLRIVVAPELVVRGSTGPPPV